MGARLHTLTPAFALLLLLRLPVGRRFDAPRHGDDLHHSSFSLQRRLPICSVTFPFRFWLVDMT